METFIYHKKFDFSWGLFGTVNLGGGNPEKVSENEIAKSTENGV